MSDDGSAGVGRSWGTEDYGHPQMNNLWRFTAALGQFDLLSEPEPSVVVSPERPPLASAGSFGNHFAGGSRDFGLIVFSSGRALTADVPGDGGGALIPVYLYEWAAGRVRAVSVLPDGSFVSNAALGYGLPWTQGILVPGDYAVSVDGARIYFSTSQSTFEARELYLRERDPLNAGGERVSVHVSASERTDCARDPTCGGDDIPNPAPDPDVAPKTEFERASADGSVAFFASQAKLTDDSNASGSGGIGPVGEFHACAFARCDLYRWDADGAEGHRLSDLTAGAPDGGGVLATVGGSEDGTSVYFVAIGVLAPNAVDGEPNLYLWREGQGIRLIATLDAEIVDGKAADEGIWNKRQNPSVEGTHSFSGTRVTPDGRFLVFRSRAKLTDYDNQGRYQLYRYDANDQSLACVSCNPLLGASSGDTFLKRDRAELLRPPWLSRNVSLDGHVMFDSAEALVAGDTNGRIDVYESNGQQIQLISSGSGAGDSIFLDASETGGDVFFTTRQRLLHSDKDNFIDVYDARVDALPPPSDPEPPCEGDSCKGSPIDPPVLTPLATPHVHGPTAGKPKIAPKPKSKRCRKRTVRRRAHNKVKCSKKKPVKRSYEGRR